MGLSNSEVQKIVNAVAIRLGKNGLVTAHPPANMDDVLVIQLIGTPSYEFSLNRDATEEQIRAKAEAIFSVQKAE